MVGDGEVLVIGEERVVGTEEPSHVFGVKDRGVEVRVVSDRRRQKEFRLRLRDQEGEEIPVKRGSVLRFDPETTRVPVAGPDGLTMIAVGTRRGSYEPRGPF